MRITSFPQASKCLIVCLSLLPGMAVKAEKSGAVWPIIVSPTTPRDSRNEIVYERQGKNELTVPIVPGAFVLFKVLKTIEPTYPESLRAKRKGADVKVQGIVAENGDLIDAKALGDPTEDIAASAVNAVSQYKFLPATLDGKPIAVLVQIKIMYRMR